MNKKILIPYGIKTKLSKEFNVSRPTIERWLLGATARDEVKRNTIRQRALQLGGAYVYEQ